MRLQRTASVDLLRAADLLNEAVARDPSFFQAYCLLAHTHDLLYYLWASTTRLHVWPRRKQQSRRLFACVPIRVKHILHARRICIEDTSIMAAALVDLEIARQTLPNDPRVFELKGYIERRQGRWEEATRDLEHAIDLDPRDAFMVRRMALAIIYFSDAMLTKNPCWNVRWSSSRTMLRTKVWRAIRRARLESRHPTFASNHRVNSGHKS